MGDFQRRMDVNSYALDSDRGTRRRFQRHGIADPAAQRQQDNHHGKNQAAHGRDDTARRERFKRIEFQI
jgi:hypothetical protein